MASINAKMILFLLNLKGVGNKFIISKLWEIKNSKDFKDLILKCSITLDSESFNKSVEFVNEQVDLALSMNHKIISILDLDFPKWLKETSDTPVILFCSGNTSLLSYKCVSVIGTREPTKAGAAIAERVTSALVNENFCIVSGLAEGIDAIAHQTTIDLSGSTIAVLAHGLEKIYPAKNRELAGKIINNGGLLVSEYPYKSFVGKSNFVQRDRIQAGLSLGVFLIQTGIKGGSLHASRKIIEYRRRLFVVGQAYSDIYNMSEKALGNIELLKSDKSVAREILGLDADYERDIYCLNSKFDFDLAFKILNEISFIGDSRLL